MNVHSFVVLKGRIPAFKNSILKTNDCHRREIGNSLKSAANSDRKYVDKSMIAAGSINTKLN